MSLIDTARARTNENEVLKLRLQGDPQTGKTLTWDQIAAQYGYANGSAARNAALRPLMRELAANAEEYRAQEVARIMGLLDKFTPMAAAGDYKAFDRVMNATRLLADILGLKHSDKLAERQQILNEQIGDLMAAVLKGVLGDLELTPEQQEQAKPVVMKHLAALSAPAS